MIGPTQLLPTVLYYLGMNLNYTGNEYMDFLGDDFDRMPKAVLAAIAVSLASRLTSDNKEEAANLIRREWWILYQNGIIKQKPRVPNVKTGAT